MAKSWFERNTKKTIFILLFSSLVAIAYGTEKLLAYKSQGIGFSYALPDRAIRLREYRPFLQEKTSPTPTELKAVDSVENKAYILRIDKDGFIVPSKKYAHPDKTIVFLGGSTTECHYMGEDERFPYLTGVLLERELGIKLNSYNAARAGNNSLHSMDIFLNKIIPLKPDIVVVMHNINDLTTLLYEKSYWSLNQPRAVIFDMNQEVLSNYWKIMRDKLVPHLAAAMRDFDWRLRLWLKSDKGSKEKADPDEFAHLRGQKLQVNPEDMVAQFEMNLQTFINLCKARNITVVLMTMANRLKENPDPIIHEALKKIDKGHGISYQEFKALFDKFNEAVRRKAAENGVLLIDLAKEIPQERAYLYDVVHYNGNGSKKAAEIIKDYLKPGLMPVLRAP
jgi:lysophospholipase L1-like esterase